MPRSTEMVTTSGEVIPFGDRYVVTFTVKRAMAAVPSRSKGEELVKAVDAEAFAKGHDFGAALLERSPWTKAEHDEDLKEWPALASLWGVLP